MILAKNKRVTNTKMCNNDNTARPTEVPEGVQLSEGAPPPPEKIDGTEPEQMSPSQAADSLVQTLVVPLIAPVWSPPPFFPAGQHISAAHSHGGLLPLQLDVTWRPQCTRAE